MNSPSAQWIADGSTARITCLLKGDASCPSINGLSNTSRYQAEDITICRPALQ